jgi:GTP-binding protein Era
MKCGYIALIGAPNAGKSTLLNALTESSISIITPKPQTTRGKVRGIINKGNTQLIFMDTPGIFNAGHKFEKAMVDSAWSGVDECDAIVLVVDAHRGADDDTRQIIASLKSRAKPAILVLNKVDKAEKAQLPELAKKLYDLFDFQRSFMVSAKRGNGVKDINDYLASLMPDSPWFYGEDEITDMPERQLAAEITREQCFLKLHAELPYGLMVNTEKWEEKNIKGRRSIKIHQAIILERESHKKIILGKGGVMLKAIGSSARGKIGKMLDADAHLFLFVKIDEKWKDDPASFSAAGLEYKK